MIQESGEMYLETILILSQTSNEVRAVNISDYMGYSKPSVSRAIGLLKEGGYLIVDSNGLIALTGAGYQLAQKIYERHEVLAKTLMAIGVDEKNAYADACKIEHDISDATFEAIKKHVGSHQPGKKDEEK